MAKKIGNACISTGEYEKDGVKKKSWLTIGTIFLDDKGNESVRFEVGPVFTPDKNGYGVAWVKLFKDDDRKQQPAYKPYNEHQQSKANAYQPEPRYSAEDRPPLPDDNNDLQF
jgi:hypothetical protein